MVAFCTFMLLGMGFYTCTAQGSHVGTVVLKPDSKHVILLLDSTAAAATITQDEIDQYFRRVNVSEMTIQMKQPLDTDQTRDNLLGYYMSFLREDMGNYTEDELKFVEKVIEKVFKTVQGVSPNIMPDTLKLIKTKGRHYGDGVWYTRENCIIIPADELDRKKTNPFTNTMYHEVFHVYSRLNPAKSAELYSLIGFQGIGMDNLLLPPKLESQVLYNPDGVNFAQKIALKQSDGSTVYAIPIIYSKHYGFQTDIQEFFGYLEFNIFQIEQQPDGKWRVVVAEDGFTSTLKLDSQPDFFAQIRDNTGYIIHPDEVLADNFSFIMQEETGAKVTIKFSKAGKMLISEIEKILRTR